MLDIVLLMVVLMVMAFGFYKGVIIQAFGLMAIVCAFFFASTWGAFMVPTLENQLSLTRFFAQKTAAVLMGVSIYIGFWLLGKLFEKIFIEKISALKWFNRLGGALMGALKACFVIVLLLSFLALFPDIKFPLFDQSRIFSAVRQMQLLGDVKLLTSIKRFGQALKNPRLMKKMSDSKKAKELFDLYGVDLQNHEFVEAVKKTDVKKIKDNEKIETLMKDDELSDLLEELEKEGQ